MKIALVGNQNCGKSTLFNLLTGGNRKVGNWAGVTVDAGQRKIKGTKIFLVDLPGLYSLCPYSSEEEVTINYLLNDAEFIINVIDATNLERGLYLTTQLIDLKIPLLVVLNKIDEFQKNNIKIDYEKLEKFLGVKTFAVSANKNIGIDNLLEFISYNI